MRATEHTIEARAPLVVKWRWSKTRIAGVDRRAARQRHVRERRAAVILQRYKPRICIDLIAWPVQITAAIVAADIVSMRCDRAAVVENVFARCACIEDRVGDCKIAL